MSLVTYLGFPRIGLKRELKRALESFWRGESDAAALQQAASELRLRHWRLAQDAGADVVPVNDFSLYDHVLDHAVMFDAVPDSHRAVLDADFLTGYFALARGLQKDGHDLRALEMTKWFDTNYHYLVPELRRGQTFRLRDDKPVREFIQARDAGLRPRPVLLGPVSFLLLAKTTDGSARLALLDALLPCYVQLLAALKQAGAEWVQIDEPFLVLDLDEDTRHAYEHAWEVLSRADGPKRLLTTYFGALGDNAAFAARLPANGLHIDLVRGPDQLDDVLRVLPSDRTLSLGLADGRNVWRADLDKALLASQRAHAQLPSRQIWLSSSCSLLHVPIDLAPETALPGAIRPWLSFARQKIEELRTIADAQRNDAGALAALAAARAARAARLLSPLVTRPGLRRRLEALTADQGTRKSPYAVRAERQREALRLPLFPTTTIGSFPQTRAVREARARNRAGLLSDADYQAYLEKETAAAVQTQEQLGIDVLVHGEFERNDMVEYFGEQLDGYAFTRLGWVQSYGSRCVKPPIIYGDVTRPAAMTVQWSRYAQSLTILPMKGMLTGPVTMLNWSFVRDDQPRADTCRQIALALRDEVLDLEAAGIRIIQIDEPALREGLPLRRTDWAAYLQWAVECFRLTANGVADETQIHTHMCYSEFNDIIDAVAAMDADVVSIETSRSRMELLDAFVRFRYPNGIGPGVYDIHSPRVPGKAEMLGLLRKALDVLPAEQLWVNPDCGLKTRDWPEVRTALAAMVSAARELRLGVEAAA
ncbi:5-methyltetrahydropteroyltriglutamate--homocysteine S-methyltransferase [Tahibacter amnicola]|uniref:5-methyltetrahydropteroyltriglutamate--homocysteine methyltransferase n=1 Tax=Tahibacter amnicola TaxID=2976241 RepID=A0ABY6BEC7_9GAMM|nr:5-methyltetrahydropteroyltriglutamate--homocysteine S-methyltransferase [Tahibacter amnicola]UXI67603.1 5-methyltetrahydropteroyltriglutamate--homocysteine S-methyltransferase [Tahibacter amnicola]